MDCNDFPDGGRAFRRKERIRDLCDGALKSLSRIFEGVSTTSENDGRSSSPTALPVALIASFSPCDFDQRLSQMALEMGAQAGVKVYAVGMKEASHPHQNQAYCVSYKDGCLLLFVGDPFDCLSEAGVRALVGHELSHQLHADSDRRERREALERNIFRSYKKIEPFLVGGGVAGTAAAAFALGATPLPGVLASLLAYQSLRHGRDALKAGVHFLRSTAERQQEYMADMRGAALAGDSRAFREIMNFYYPPQGDPLDENMLSQMVRTRFDVGHPDFHRTHPPWPRRMHSLGLAFGSSHSGGGGSGSVDGPDSEAPLPRLPDKTL